MTNRELNNTLLRLMAACSVPVLLALTRMAYTGTVTYRFLLWNLFLAAVPLMFAYLTLRATRTRRITALLYAPAWLLFFPNAPYLITDMMHLRYDQGINVLYDVVMLFTFALCGIVLAFVSLRWMQVAFTRRLGIWWSRLFVVGVLGLAGFGIYLGRVLRWNSWDVVFNPTALIGDILPRVMDPLTYWQTWSMSLLFAFLLIFVYWLLTALPKMGLSEALDPVERS